MLFQNALLFAKHDHAILDKVMNQIKHFFIQSKPMLKKIDIVFWRSFW